MEIRVLGEVTLYRPDGPVPLDRIGERILLAVLAIHAGRDVDTATLLRLLGDGGGEQIAARTLTDYITAVRAALQKAGGSRSMLPDARRRRGTYRLDIDPDLVDYGRFQSRALAARGHADTGDHHAAVAVYQQAIGEWKGRPLTGLDRPSLDGLRHQLQEEYRFALRGLLTAQLHTGDHEQMIRAARRAIDEHPADDITELAVHALARAGRRTDIPGFCDYAAGRMRAMFGADLDPTVRQLADALVKSPQHSYRVLSTARPTTPAMAVRNDVGVRFSLPPDTFAFTGRTGELAAITATVTQAAQLGGVVAIHAIDGMPGVGKTTLAVHAAHQLVHRYPDAQLFVDLHGHTPGLPSTDPADALADLLRADGVAPRQLPDSLDARAALWRDRMSGRRALLVLDNVQSTGQVAPLLPGADTVLVLITSRRQLGDLRQAAHLTLEVLPHTDAVAMFLRLAPHAADEPDAVGELVRMCQHLPLAIAILASRHAAHPTWTMTDLLIDFQASREPLLTVRSEDATVNAAFELSYRHLPTERQRFFRLLGLAPGVDIDSYAAAALAGTTVDDATEHLDELYNDHLLDETAPRRYRMHDLVRAYTHTLATATESADAREQAVDRLLDYYQHTGRHADALITNYARPGTAHDTSPVAAPDLSGWDHALAWLRAERSNLEACLRHAATGRQDHRIVGLTAGLATLLRRDGPWPQAIALHQNAARAATGAGDKAGHADALDDLGMVRLQVGDYPAAEELLRQALSIHIETGNRVGQATALNELGRARLAVGDYPAAENLIQQGLGIHLETGNRVGQATALHELGIARWLLGDYPAAEELLHRALTIHTETGHRHGQARTFHNLGMVRWLLGDYPAAEGLLHQAVTIHTHTGDRLGQANALTDVGMVRWLVGDYRAAEDLLRQALIVHTETGYRLGRAHTLQQLGIVQRLAGDHAAADDLLQQALDTYTEIGNRHGQANTRIQIGAVRYLAGDHDGAEDQLQQALTALRAIGAPDDEAEALNHLGHLRRLSGRPDHAMTHHTEALTLARGIHHRLEQAHALEGLGRAALDLGDPATAIIHLRQALELYEQLGVPEAGGVAATLAEIDPTADER